jgi:DNA polymerase-3 subunit gamma/tau
MAARSLSYPAALQDLGVLLHRIALAQTVPSAVPEDLPERDDIVRLAGLFDAEEIQLFYQIAVHGRNELGLAPDEYAGFSMTLLRMLAFRPGVGGMEVRAAAPVSASTAPVARLSAAPQVAVSSAPAPRPVAGLSPARAALEAARGGKKMNGAPGSPTIVAPAPVVAAAPVPEPAQTQARRESPMLNGAPPWMEEAPDMPPYDIPDGAAASNGESFVMPVAENGHAAVARVAEVTAKPPRPFLAVPELKWDGNWPQLAANLPVRGVAQQLAQQSELIMCDVSGELPLFKLRIAVETLRAAGSIEKLAAALTDFFARPVRVQTELGAVEQTANAAALAERDARLKQTEQIINNDPFVQNLMREFGARIVPGSIKPI